jgi:hypothetical protein
MDDRVDVPTISLGARPLARWAAVKAGWIGLVGSALIAAFAVAFVVSKGVAEQKRATPPKAVQSTPVAPQQTYQVSSSQAVYLVRSTLVTVNDANRSGNYSVLHNLATPDFQAKNTPADLAVAFLNLRRRNLDLFALALAPPEFTAAPAIDSQGVLRLTGFFPIQPRQLNFDLFYQVVNGQWRIQGIAIAIPEAPAPEAQLQPPAKPVPTDVSSSFAIAPMTDTGPIAPKADAGSQRP